MITVFILVLILGCACFWYHYNFTARVMGDWSFVIIGVLFLVWLILCGIITKGSAVTGQVRQAILCFW